METGNLPSHHTHHTHQCKSTQESALANENMTPAPNTSNIYSMRVVQMKPVCGTASEYGQLQVITQLYA
jgi:hypothetical protein